MSTEVDRVKTDIILSMAHTATEDYMEQIVERKKNYEFRKKLYPSSVKRIWFYETSPISAITHICMIESAHVRPPKPKGSPKSKGGMTMATENPLPENGIGNKEYNEYHADWVGYDYAYKITGCWRIPQRIDLSRMKEYGLGGAPRGMVYVPKAMMQEYKWDEQVLIWKDPEEEMEVEEAKEVEEMEEEVQELLDQGYVMAERKRARPHNSHRNQSQPETPTKKR